MATLTARDMAEIKESAKMAQEHSDVDAPTLVLTLDQVHQISALLGLNISTAQELIQRVRAMRQISVEGVDITLDPGLVTRLRSRCLKKDGFADYLTSEIKRLLHGAVGW